MPLLCGLGLALAGLGCPSSREDGAAMHVGAFPVHASVVAMVAAREGVDRGTAQTRVLETLRLAADAQAQGAAAADLSEDRRRQLLRAARARRWAEDVFEPRHDPEDIPEDRVRSVQDDPRFDHPRLHRLCQLVAIPTREDPARREPPPDDPAWWARARIHLERVATRLAPYLAAEGQDRCAWIPKLLRFEAQVQGDVTIRYESGAFDLEACAEQDPAGECTRPRWDPAWKAAVERGTAPGFLAPFESALGVHWVYLDAIMPAQSGSSEAGRANIRETLHPAWQREAFAHALVQLRSDAAVKLEEVAPEEP